MHLPPMDRTVVSRLRTGPVCIWILGIAASALYVVYADLHGHGIRETLLYETTGIVAYPIFYGSVLAAIALLLRMFVVKDEWLTVSKQTITVGNRQVPLNEVRYVEIRRNWIGLRELVLRRT